MFTYAGDIQRVRKESLSPHSWNPLPLTNQSIQPASRVAGRYLVNSLLLDPVETEIYLGGA
jgi:hypothetical protein